MNGFFLTFSIHQKFIMELIGFIGGSAAVSIATEMAKRMLSIESEKITQVVFLTVAFLAAAGQYFIVDKAHLPPSILGINTATLMGVATPVYFYFVKPISTFIDDFKAWSHGQQVSIPKPTTVAQDKQALSDSAQNLGQEFKF